MRTRSSQIAAVSAAAIAALTFGASAETTVQGSKGPSTTTTPYLVPVAAGVRTVSILTVGDTVNPKLDGVTPYRMIGLPDGLGAFDNGDGTFTLTMNHELTTGSPGIARVHGSNASFVSVWRIDRKTLQVQSVNDLDRIVYSWNPTTQTYVQGTFQWARFCSADVPAVSAFYDAATGLGTTERFHMNGEESYPNNSRAWAHQITGSNAGVTTELPKLGRQSWENAVACPFAQTKTIVGCDDDSTPGQVYIYVGTKLATGTEVQKAGLTNGTLYGVIANGQTLESQATGIGLAKGVAGPFTLAALPDQSQNSATYSTTTETDATTAGVTKFNRPEDGAWDPLHPSDYYFVTTDGALPNGRSRLWRLHFTDIANPQNGGTVTMMLDGTEGGDMFDNIAIDHAGHVLLCEDLGTNAKSGKVWQFDIVSGAFTTIAKHDTARFGDTGITATAPFNTDEEASGIIDASDVLGPGWFLIDSQAHYNPGDAELVEGGQLLALWNPESVTAPVITAAASASLTPASVDDTIDFTVSASSVGDGVLTYAWDFGDGTNAAGRSVSHAYSAPGVYTAIVTVTHTASGKTATSQVGVNVRRPMGRLALSVALNFAKSSKDSLTLTGEIPVAAAFDPTGKQVVVNIGGVQRTFTLTASGAGAPSATDAFRLLLRKSGGAIAAQRAKFTLSLRNVDLAGALADEKLTSRTVSNDPVAVRVSITFDGRTEAQAVDLIYTATAGKKGSAR